MCGYGCLCGWCQKPPVVAIVATTQDYACVPMPVSVSSSLDYRAKGHVEKQLVCHVSAPALNTYMCMCVNVHACVRACVCLCVCVACICPALCIYMCLYVTVHVHVLACVCVCVRACVCVCEQSLAFCVPGAAN